MCGNVTEASGSLIIIGVLLLFSTAVVGLDAWVRGSQELKLIVNKLGISGIAITAIGLVGKGAVFFHAKWLQDKSEQLLKATNTALTTLGNESL